MLVKYFSNSAESSRVLAYGLILGFGFKKLKKTPITSFFVAADMKRSIVWPDKSYSCLVLFARGQPC